MARSNSKEPSTALIKSDSDRDIMGTNEKPDETKMRDDDDSNGQDSSSIDDDSDESEDGSESDGKKKTEFEYVTKEESSSDDSSSSSSSSDSSDDDSDSEDDEIMNEKDDEPKEKQVTIRKIKFKAARNDEGEVKEGPTVITFKNGTPQALNNENDDDLDEVDDKEISFEYRKVTTANRISSHNSAVVGKDDTCQYKGYYFKNDKRNNDTAFTKRFVGVFDKVTNTIELYPSHQNGHEYSMEQSILRKRKYTHEELDIAYDDSDVESENENHTTTISSYSDRQRLLIASFGSAKKQKLLKTKEANKLDPTAVIGLGDTMQAAFEKQQMSASNVNAMLKVMDNQKTDEVAEAEKESRRQFLPEYNEAAKAPCDVFKPQLIAGDTLWSLLTKHTAFRLKNNNKNSTLDKEWIQAFLTPNKVNNIAMGAKSLSTWPTSMVELIKNIHNNPSSNSNQYIITTILLLCDFVKLHKYTQRSITKGKKADRFNDNVLIISTKLKLVHASAVFRFLELFSSDAGLSAKSDTSSNNQTPEYQNRVFTKQNTKTRFIYMLILYIICHSQSSMKVANIQPFLDEIELSTKDATNYLRMAGFHVTIGNKGDLSVSLKVPLTFPSSVRRRRATYG